MTEAKITIEDAVSSSPDKIFKIVHITGQLDESNIDEKIQEVYKVLEAHPKNLNLVFDMENLEYMNSKSIGYITDVYGKVTESLGQVAIAKARPNITDILQVVGLSQLIKMFETTEEAKAYLENSSASITLATDDEPSAPEAAVSPPVEQVTAETPAPAQPATTIEPVDPVPAAVPVQVEVATEEPTTLPPSEPLAVPIVQQNTIEATPALTPEVSPMEPVAAEVQAPDPVTEELNIQPAAPDVAPIQSVPVPTPETPTPTEEGTEGTGTFNIG